MGGDGQFRKEIRDLEAPPHPQSDSFVGGQSGDIHIVKEYLSLCGLKEAADEIKKGGFPGSVRTDNRSDRIGS